MWLKLSLWNLPQNNLMNKKLSHKKINSSTTQSENPKLLKYPYLIILILILIVYVQTLRFDFVYLDDDLIILDNYDKISSLSNIVNTFSTQYGFNQGTPYYRPVTNLSFIIDAQFSGKSPVSYHLSNLIFNFITSSLLFLLLCRLNVKKGIALFLSLIFAVHPLLTNAVVWIVGRNDMLAGLFCTLSFIYFLKYIGANKNKYLYLHSLFYLIAIFSKEVSIVLPLICAHYLYWLSAKRSDKSTWSKLVLSWILPSLLSQVLRVLFIPPVQNVTYGLPALIMNIRAVPELFTKIFIPVYIAVLPTFTDIRTLVGSIILIVYLALPFMFRSIDKKKYYFGAVWFLVFTLPGLFIVYSDQKEKFEYLDSRAYLPMIGILISLAAVLYSSGFDILKRKHLAVGIGVICLISVLTFVQSKKYENAVMFAQSAVDSNPQRAFFYEKLADYYYTNQDYPKAIIYLSKTIEKSPGNFIHYKNLSLAFAHTKQIPKAIQTLEKAYTLNPNDFEVIQALIRLNYETGQYDQSLKYADKVIENGGEIDHKLYQDLKDLASKMSNPPLLK
jgi:protein O-mannosyl-transferase